MHAYVCQLITSTKNDFSTKEVVSITDGLDCDFHHLCKGRDSHSSGLIRNGCVQTKTRLTYTLTQCLVAGEVPR